MTKNAMNDAQVLTLLHALHRLTSGPCVRAGRWRLVARRLELLNEARNQLVGDLRIRRFDDLDARALVAQGRRLRKVVGDFV